METLARPGAAEVFVDPRGSERALRVSWHPEVGLVVLSLWQGDVCTGTFRLPAAELPQFVAACVSGPAAVAAVTSRRY